MCWTENSYLLVGYSLFVQDDSTSGTVVADGHIEENVIGVREDVVVVGTTFSCGGHG